ncbi:hypothetical protein, partial [Caulobacter sp. 17J65-9]|uniref:MotE family protein n=1 Tax=Caulobacter sp. 17J65-9 TaxID=2709382 RepID=UPI0013CB1D08
PAVAVKPAAPVCAPSATELAKAAGLSPAELRVLQSLQSRRGELDDREKNMDTQLALMAAAEAKLDAKLKALEALKGDINGLLAQGDQREAAEITRLVKVYEAMKPKDAADVMTQLDDRVRLPVASKMKERSLAAVLAAMPAAEARKLTEKLAMRYAAADAAAEKLVAPNAPAAKPAAKAG